MASATSLVALAQPVDGFYVGSGLGGVFLHGGGASVPALPRTAAPAVPAEAPPASAGPARHDSFGYGLGTGLSFDRAGPGNRLRLPKGP